VEAVDKANSCCREVDERVTGLDIDKIVLADVLCDRTYGDPSCLDTHVRRQGEERDASVTLDEGELRQHGELVIRDRPRRYLLCHEQPVRRND
jgi:hypothetical protein